LSFSSLAVTKTDKALVKPPKKPPGGYVIFLTKYIKASDKPRRTLAENQVLFAEAARVWNGLSDLEKQVCFWNGINESRPH
jgi:hypothetical protein